MLKSGRGEWSLELYLEKSMESLLANRTSSTVCHEDLEYEGIKPSSII